MSVNLLGIFAYQLALALIPAWAWLIVCKLVPVSRRRVNFTYCIAAVYVLLSCLLSHRGNTGPGLVAMATAEIVLYARWRKALKDRSLEANTIINYESHDIF